MLYAGVPTVFEIYNFDVAQTGLVFVSIAVAAFFVGSNFPETRKSLRSFTGFSHQLARQLPLHKRPKEVANRYCSARIKTLPLLRRRRGRSYVMLWPR